MWVMMNPMKVMGTFRRMAGSQNNEARAVMRLREPQGLISSDTATELLMPFVGSTIGAADTSMERLVVAITTEPMHLLVIAGPVVVSVADGPGSGSAVSVCHAPGDPQTVAGLDQLAGRQITEVVVTPNGSLRIGVQGGSLSVDSDPDYEAWELRGMDGGLFACLPGGAISLWTPAAA